MEIRVSGMTCDHCVHAVTSELMALEDVVKVEVDLVPGGASTVHIEGSVPLEGIRAAIDEAGYEVLD